MPNLDTDTDSLADERTVESALGNPLRDAISNFRSGRDGSAESPQDDDDEESPEVEQDLDEDAEEEVVEDDQDEPAEDSADDEDEEPVEDEESEDDDKSPESKKPKLSSVDIPMPNADGTKGPRGTGKVTLDGVPQQAADAIRHYMKQADRIPLLEEQLAVASEGAQIADFLESDPFAAMVMINTAVPDKMDEFVKSWIQQNPSKIGKFVEELDLENMTERELKLAAKEATRDATERAKQAYQGHSNQFQFQKQADQLLLTAQDLARTAGVEKDDMEEFMFVSSRRIAKLYQQNPRITNREVVAALQPVVAKYAKAVSPTKTPKVTPKDPSKTFKTKVGKSQKFVVVGSGKTPLKVAGGFKKPPKGTTTLGAIKMLRAGKFDS